MVGGDKVTGRGRGGSSSRLVGIEGLRAVAAVTIVVYHVWLYAAPGGARAPLGPLDRVFAHFTAGVTLFFVLSGFLLFRPYVASAMRGTRSPRVRQYFANRALRILPAYWVVLLAVAFLFQRDLWYRPFALLANASFLQYSIPHFVPDDLVAGNGLIGIVPSWSLAVEVVFYLAVPVLGGLAIVLTRRRLPPLVAAFLPVALMLGIGFTAKVVAHAMGGDTRVIWEFAFPVHADWFAVGMAVAVLRVLWEDGRLQIPRFFASGALGTALVLCIGAVWLLQRGALNQLEYQTPIALACGLLLASVVLPRSRGLLLRGLDSRPLVAVGLVSYSLFLIHDPMLRGLREAGLTRPGLSGFAVNLIVIAGLSGAASYLTYRWVEKPALALKRSWQGADSQTDASVDAFGTITRGELEQVRPALAIHGRHAQDELEQLVAAVAGSRRDEVMLVTPPGPEPHLSPQALEVCWHLLQNALRYGAAPIVLTLSRDRGRVRLSVEDAGRGVSPDFVPSLFHARTRSHSSEQEAAGFGLGLYVSRALAEHVGGALSFTAAKPTGACFTLEIDATEPDEKLGSADRSAKPIHARSKGRTVTFLMPAVGLGPERHQGSRRLVLRLVASCVDGDGYRRSGVSPPARLGYGRTADAT